LAEEKGWKLGFGREWPNYEIGVFTKGRITIFERVDYLSRKVPRKLGGPRRFGLQRPQIFSTIFPLVRNFT